MDELHVGKILSRRGRRGIEVLGGQVRGHDVSIVVMDVWQPVTVRVAGERVPELEAPDLVGGERLGRLDELLAGLRKLRDPSRLEQIDVVEDAEGSAQRADT